MPSRTLPGIGLKGDWDLGEDLWKDEMDTNLLVLSALVQLRVLDIVDADPGAPANGNIYFFNSDHPTQANKVAIRDDGAWVYIAAFEGLWVYNVADNTNYQFDGADLVEVTSGGGGLQLPVVTVDADDYTVLAADNNKYIRLTDATAKTITVQDDATEALPDDGEWHFRNAGAGDATFDPDVGVVINVPAGGTLVFEEGMTVTLKRVAGNEFDLFGQTVPV